MTHCQNRMPISWRIIPVVVLGFAVACGGGGEKPAQGSAAAATGGTPDLDACAVLREVDLAGFLGATPDTLVEILKTSREGMAVAQCVASVETSPLSLGLMLRYGAEGGNPSTRGQWVDRELGSDVMGMGEEAAAAIRAAESVSGLGNLALAYEMIGSNLAVFWGNGRYQLVATSTGFADPARARQALEAVARQALSTY
jgi:hypothetical protein